MAEIAPCACSDWEHELFDGCPPPNPPRRCCGTTDYERDQFVRSARGCCTNHHCACGKYLGGMGPAGCPCGDEPVADVAPTEEARRG